MIFAQKAKITWLQLGDGNNSFVKENNKGKTIGKLENEDGKLCILNMY